MTVEEYIKLYLVGGAGFVSKYLKTGGYFLCSNVLPENAIQVYGSMFVTRANFDGGTLMLETF